MPLEKKLFLKKLREQFPEASEEQCQSAYLRSGGFLGQGAALLRSGGQLEPQTDAFAQSYAGRNSLELLRVLTSMEKLKREQLCTLLSQWREMFRSARFAAICFGNYVNLLDTGKDQLWTKKRF